MQQNMQKIQTQTKKSTSKNNLKEKKKQKSY